jgi:hypothetical protein
MQLPDAQFTRLVKHHTLHLDAPIQSSTGNTTDYFDGIGVWLCLECRKEADKYFENALYIPPMPSDQEAVARWNGDIDNGQLYSHLLKPETPIGTGLWLWPVATGASGAIILGRLGHGTYLRPQDKSHGPLWRQLQPATYKHFVALVDDCIFTGATMAYAREQCEKAGLEVVREIVLMGESPADGSIRNLKAVTNDESLAVGCTRCSPEWRASSMNVLQACPNLDCPDPLRYCIS